ncbi:MAG: aminomethyl-transferring glycine dehydrogenase subunit GcvPA [Frankiaceae bacterium]
MTAAGMDYTPHTDAEVAEMLAVLDVDSVDALFAAQVPAGLLVERLDLPDGLAEAEVLARMKQLAARNSTIDDGVCWLGGGVYDHYVPAVVGAVVGRPEFATAYTPYQPEMSQGNLQALFEFQTLASEVLGLPVANSSLYDGPTAVVEAVTMCLHATGRSRVLVSGGVDPRIRQLLRTHAPGLAVELVGLPLDGDGRTQVRPFPDDTAALVVQHPNVFGVLEDVPGCAEAAHRAGARLAVSFDLLLSGVLEPPGRLGADIVTADGLSAGNSLAFGGPGCGLLACRADDVRRLPGRLVGRTLDADGRNAYVLTLQAREQHIRRERATSNICTNQALNALAVAVYLSWLGPRGLAELGETCLAGAAYAAERLAEAGLPLAFPGGVFGKEFAVRVDDPHALAAGLAQHGHLVGPVVAVPDGDVLLVAVTEQRTRAQVDDLAATARSVREELPEGRPRNPGAPRAGQARLAAAAHAGAAVPTAAVPNADVPTADVRASG